MASKSPYTDDELQWQEYYQDFCIENFGGREHDEASAYADQMMEENENGK